VPTTLKDGGGEDDVYGGGGFCGRQIAVRLSWTLWCGCALIFWIMIRCGFWASGGP